MRINIPFQVETMSAAQGSRPTHSNLTMPPRKKGAAAAAAKKKAAAAAAAAAAATPSPPPADDQLMETDIEPAPAPEEPTSTSLLDSAAELVEKAENIVEHVVEAVEEKIADVAEAAEQFVDEMAGIEQTFAVSDATTPAEATDEVLSEAKKLTMEERKAKLDQLRKKMVISFDAVCRMSLTNLHIRRHRRGPTALR